MELYPSFPSESLSGEPSTSCIHPLISTSSSHSTTARHHRIAIKMTSPDYSHHFSLQNLPFGVASSSQHPNRQCATRLLNTVIFLGDLQRSGLFASVSDLPSGIFDEATVNSYAALSKETHLAVRQILQSSLQASGTEGLPPTSIEDITKVQLHLPITVPGFTGMMTPF